MLPYLNITFNITFSLFSIFLPLFAWIWKAIIRKSKLTYFT